MNSIPLDFTLQSVWLMVIWVIRIFFVQVFCVFLTSLLDLICFYLGLYHFCTLLCPSLDEIFLKRSCLSPSVVFLYFFALFIEEGLLVSLAILWNSALSWMYLSLFPLLISSLLSSAICKISSDHHFAFLLYFFFGLVLFTASWTILQTSVHSSSGTLFTRSNPLNLFVPPLYINSGFKLYLTGLVSFPTLFSLSLNSPMRSWWSGPQSVPGHVFADCIQLSIFNYKECNLFFPSSASSSKTLWSSCTTNDENK